MAENDRLTGLVGNAAFKVPCKAASTAALVLLGEQTVDGIALVTGDRCLVKNQAAGADNGIYIVDTGAWQRSKDADGSYDVVRGSVVYVNQGTVSAGLFYVLTSADPITVGTTALTWLVVSPSSPIALPLSIAQGGTGQITATAVLGALGIMQLTGAAGTANAQTANGPSSEGVIAANQLFEFTPAITNTGAVTLTITPSGGAALAARSIFYDGAACAGGELVLGVPTLLLDDGTRLNIVGYSRKIRGAALGGGASLINGTIVCSVLVNALTIAIKTLAGADPSAADPVGITFRNPTSATGDYTVLWLTAATSLVLSNGSTLGTTANIANRYWIVGFNDAGTFRLGAVNCLSGTSVMALRDDNLYSSTAEGGAGAADSAQVIYTGTAVAAKALRILGYLEYSAGCVTAGVYNLVPTKLQLFGPGVPLPGSVVQIGYSQDGATANGATATPWDDTIPQSGEGNQFMTQAITPTATCNLLQITHTGNYASSAGDQITAALHQDAVANALAAVMGRVDTANQNLSLPLLRHRMIAATVIATTFKVRVGGAAASTITFNGSAAARKLGGVAASSLLVEEIMG